MSRANAIKKHDNNIPIYIYFNLLQLRASFNISLIDKLIINPATNNKTKERKISLIQFLNNKYVSRAPSGSVSPENRVYKKVLLFPTPL